MATAYVIHARRDTDFVRNRLVRALPVLGYDHWISSDHLRGRDAPRDLDNVATVLAVVSEAAAQSDEVRREVTQLLNAGRRLVPVQIDATRPRQLAAALEAPAHVDLSTPGQDTPAAPIEQIAVLLEPLLPPPIDQRGAGRGVSGREHHAERTEWNEEVFSAFLSRAVARHDHSGSAELVERFIHQNEHRAHPYGAHHADRDLGTLRRSRQFPLMQRYARAVLRSGTRDFVVQRQLAQSLIELGEYDEAVAILEAVMAAAGKTHAESYEARGLLGRVCKQQYVNAPASHASTLLLRAIDYYKSVFDEDTRLVWHGINAASCLMRSERDAVRPGDGARSQELARAVLASLGALEREQQPSAFELATRVEALALLEDFERADTALTAYLAHPGAHAFEVSSTHRQFAQVLQLHEHGRGRLLLDRLWDAVERQRAPIALRGGEWNGQRSTRVPVLVTVTDPHWTPTVPGCEIRGRVGSVVAMECDPSAIKTILDDPLVVGLEESRRTGNARECQRSVPFIGVSKTYPSLTGTFEEAGTRALIAVIDDGIDVLHRAFLDANGQSRLVALWDQRDRTGPPPPGFTFGTYHDARAIASYIAGNRVPEHLGRNEEGHGTHVASIAAGRAVGSFAGGVAPDARLVVVVADTHDPLGYSTEHVAALEFIENIAGEMELPVVVNVSQGMNAGAHDGRSPLENAFDAFSEAGSKPGRVVVKSCGNEGQGQGHARITVARNSRVVVEWVRGRDPGWEYECIEFWWDSANTYRFRLRAPSGGTSEAAESTRPSVSGHFDECPYRLQLVRRHRYNGDSQLTVEIGSAADNSTPVIAGRWALEVTHAGGDAASEIHGWIERGPEPPSAFQPPHVSHDMTLSIPGTAHSVIAVGAVDATEDNVIATPPFTSFGPTRDQRKKPEVSAPGLVTAARSGTVSDVIKMAGTSMAAPHVAGVIALLLSRAVAVKMNPLPTSAQISKALQQKTRNRSGDWDPAQGFGVVDAAGLLAAFE